MARLQGKVTIVTGAAGGIGAAVVERFVEEGAAVALVDLEAEALAATTAPIRARFPEARLIEVAADLAQETNAERAVASTIAAFGRLDVLVNNCGIRSYEPLAEAKAATWQRILESNLLSYAYLARDALPALRQAKGSIVNVSSTHAFNPRAGMGQYDVTKAGIVSLTRTLAFEEAPHGVRVNCVCPGATLTPFHRRRFAAAGKSEADLQAEVANANLQRRWADPREIAHPVLWLASAEASFMTAATLMVDGGTRV